MSSWGVCGFETRDEEGDHLDDPGEGTESLADERNNIPAANGLEWSFSVPEKKAIGMKCKKLLNYGRVLFLKSKGYKVSLQRYVKDEVTLENALLCASK